VSRRRIGCGCVTAIFVFVLIAVSVGGAFWLISNINRAATNETAEAVIVDLIASRDTDGDTVYRPVVEYVVDGVVYRLESRVSYGGALVPDVGDPRTVYYDPDDPSDAVFRSFWTFWFFPILLTALPALIVAVLAAVNVGRMRRRSEPTLTPPLIEGAESSPMTSSRRRGQRIEADFMGAEPSPLDDTGRVRYRIRAQAEVDGRIRRFLGEWLDEDPTLALMKAGNRVGVYLDPDDPEWYEIDFQSEAE
jgi:hypothetical protein